MVVVASDAQSKKLAPLVRYFERKHRDREEKDVADKRVIASVQELMRAEALDQIAWTERRRRRLKAGGGDTNLPRAIAMKSSSSSPKTARTEERQRRQPKRRIGRKSAIAAKIQARAQAALDPTQAMIRIGQLKSTLTKAPDPPAAAAELAMLYLVLSDQRGALKSFQLAVKPSPERVPTKEETDKREMQERRLMLLNRDRRAEALAELEAQDVEKERERELAENARRRQAATGIFLCLLELKRPVEAAEAAGVRLGMCETEEERRQVETEIHTTLLKYDGLIESGATNQGAWLTESAGALSDLHAAVLRSLAGFSMRKSSSSTSWNGAMFEEAGGEAESTPEEAVVPAGAENNSGGKSASTREGDTTTSADRYRPIYRQQQADNNACTEDHGISAVAHEDAAYCCDAATCTGDGVRNAANPQGGIATKTTTSVTESNRTRLDQQGDNRRARLQHLGLLLARKRQFAASRQAYEDAMRGGPGEVALRERNKAHTPGVFLDAALEEASPEIGFDVDSRWQGGVHTDEAHRRALTDFACFTGFHRGAETLVAAVPAAGWAEGGSSASEVAYAERLSRPTVRADALQQQRRRQRQQPPKYGDNKTGGRIGESRAVAKAGPLEGEEAAIASGLMLRHVVPEKDVTVP